MFDTTIAGSLPKPAWLAETRKLWPQWTCQGEDLAQAKRDARAAALAARGQDPTFGDGSLKAGAAMEVLSEA